MKKGMKVSDSEEWFRESQFRKDVLRYLQRQGIVDYNKLAVLTDVAPNALKNFITGGTLVPRTLGALARICDLDLNTYVLTQAQHDAYLDLKHARTKEGEEEDGEDTPEAG